MTLSGCTSSSDDATYVLGTIGDTFVRAGLVRQGHAMTHIALYDLEFRDVSTGSVYGPCAGFTAVKQPNSPNCNGFSNFPCSDPNYPACVGFVSGQSWGKCYSQCTASGANPDLWWVWV